MRRGFTLVELLVVIAIIATLAGVGVPVIIAQKKKGDLTEAIANSKGIGLAMFNFAQDMGGYPSDVTGKTITEGGQANGMSFPGGNSNSYFRQLIAMGYADNEKTFYAKGSYTKKPDNNMMADAALAAGEVGFGYLMQSGGAALPDSGNSGRPLIVASLYMANVDGTFDPDVYGRKAVIFRMDNSATAEPIKPSDKTVLVSGRGLLTTGDGTVWGTDITPTIVPPSRATAQQ